MDNRISGKFVISGSHLFEVETRANLEDLMTGSLGGRTKPGQVFEVVVTFKTSTTDRAWATCQELGYYSDSKCEELVAPSTTCTATHYHRPNWLGDGPDAACATCLQLSITPSRRQDEASHYNHRNTE